MFQKLADKFNAFAKSPKTLDWGIKTFKGLTLLCAGGVGLWGGLTAVGLAMIALKGLGIGIPAVAGYSAIGTGLLMCAKSLVFNRVFSYTHRSLEKVKARRADGNAATPAPVPAPQPAAAASAFTRIKNGFNDMAAQARPGVEGIMKKLQAFRPRSNEKPAKPS